MNHVQATAAALMVLLAAAAQASTGANPALPAHGAAVAPAAARPAEKHFDRAAKAFAEKAYQRAAGEIRLGSALVEQQANRVAGAAQRNLHASATQLANLANSVEHGMVKDARTLDRAFDKAKHALEQSVAPSKRS